MDHEAYERTVEVGLILGIAEALRAEFGVAIDAHPGGPDNEAGAVNRAFRASARRSLKTIVPRGESLEDVVTWVLRRATLRRLAEVGVVGKRAEAQFDMEPGLGDAWSAFLALAPGAVVGEFRVGD